MKTKTLRSMVLTVILVALVAINVRPVPQWSFDFTEHKYNGPGTSLIADGPEEIPPAAAVFVADGPEEIPPSAVLIADGPEEIPPAAVLVADGPEEIPPSAYLIADGPEELSLVLSWLV